MINENPYRIGSRPQSIFQRVNRPVNFKRLSLSYQLTELHIQDN